MGWNFPDVKIRWVEVTCQLINSKIFRKLHFLNRTRTAVVVAVAAKMNNKKIGVKLKQEAHLELSQTSTMELCCENS